MQLLAATAATFTTAHIAATAAITGAFALVGGVLVLGRRYFPLQSGSNGKPQLLIMKPA
jgi:hypothetical protein